MKTVKLEVPEDLVAMFQESKLRERPVQEQVRIALAVHLFQEGVLSMGRTAELAGEPRASLELLMGEMGIPPVRYDLSDYEQDWQAIQGARSTQR